MRIVHEVSPGEVDPQHALDAAKIPEGEMETTAVSQFCLWGLSWDLGKLISGEVKVM